MRKYRHKMTGFTLVELLAVIVILAVILTIAVPNIIGIIEDARSDSFASTANIMISTAKTQVSANPDYLPAEGACSVIMMNTLDLDNVSTDADGGAYNTANSYVAIDNNATTGINYYVTLDGSRRVIDFDPEGTIVAAVADVPAVLPADVHTSLGYVAACTSH